MRITKNLDSVKETFTKALIERGVDTSNVKVKRIFANAEYNGSCEDFLLLPKNGCLRILKDILIESEKTNPNHTGLSDEKYEEYFNKTINDSFSSLAKKIDLNVESTNVQHYILNLSKDEDYDFTLADLK